MFSQNEFNLDKYKNKVKKHFGQFLKAEDKAQKLKKAFKDGLIHYEFSDQATTVQNSIPYFLLSAVTIGGSIARKHFKGKARIPKPNEITEENALTVLKNFLADPKHNKDLRSLKCLVLHELLPNIRVESKSAAGTLVDTVLSELNVSNTVSHLASKYQEKMDEQRDRIFDLN